MASSATGLPIPIERLVRSLTQLPGIGPKSALRLALHIVRAPSHYAAEFAEALIALKKQIKLCPRCQNLTEVVPCALCSDATRDPRLVCVVQRPQDQATIEKTGSFRGLYHVLHGAISPLDGVGPEHLKVAELVDRVKKDGVREVILATDSDVEGESTAHYLKSSLQKLPVKVTKLASGIPVGSSLEYLDGLTLGRALAGRRDM